MICQEDCDFTKYDYDTLKAYCSCKAKESSFSVNNMNINKSKLLQNFKHIKNFANFKFLICYKKLFSKKGILNNIGSYLILVIIFIHIINILLFYIKQFPLIKIKIKEIILGINLNNNENILKSNSIIIENIDEKKMIISKTIKKKRKKKKKHKITNAQIKYNKFNNEFDNKFNNEFNNEIIQKNIQKKNIVPIIEDNSKINITKNINDKLKIEEVKNVMKYIDEEINILSYDLAKQFDERTYCEYYISLLKTKHNIIFVLFNNNDYNSKIIKIDLLFTGFSIYYTVNTLFYNDNTMHNIYENKGKFDLETQISIIIYSSIISIILNTILKLLALSNDAIIEFKQDKSIIDINKREKDLIKKLKIKFILYFILSFAFLLFFWYYISMFCVIYKNTQVHLLKDILISFLLSMLYPFGINLLPGLFRIPALSKHKNNRECMYNFSKVLQKF